MTTEVLSRGNEISNKLAVLKPSLASLLAIQQEFEEGAKVSITIKSKALGTNNPEFGFSTTSTDDSAYLVSAPLHLFVEALEKQVKEYHTELVAL